MLLHKAGSSPLTANRYIQPLAVVKGHFMYPNNDGIFMHDNAPCHPAAFVRDWFKNILDNLGK